MEETRNRPAREVLDIQEILLYWFPPGIHEADLETYREQWLQWFAGEPEVDGEIAERFGGVLEQARRGAEEQLDLAPPHLKPLYEH